MHDTLIDVGLPLWVANVTSAPTWTVAALFTINTIGVVLFQVAVSSRVSTLRLAVRASTASGGVLVVGCVLVSLGRANRPKVKPWWLRV